jgi:glutathione S-transferase
MLKLYFAPGTCAMAVHIALEEAGTDYEAVRLDFASHDQKRPEFLAINPKARVPALVTAQGVLTETPAILAFVAQSFPAAALAPTEPFAFARAQAFNSYLCATVHVAHAHRVRGNRWTDDPAAVEALKLKVPQNMADCFALIERDMLVGPWVLGPNYSVCDAYLFTITRWLASDGVDVARFPGVQAHAQRMAARPAVQKILALHAA